MFEFEWRGLGQRLATHTVGATANASTAYSGELPQLFHDVIISNKPYMQIMSQQTKTLLYRRKYLT
jgi:hypothetical protein